MSTVYVGRFSVKNCDKFSSNLNIKILVGRTINLVEKYLEIEKTL